MCTAGKREATQDQGNLGMQSINMTLSGRCKRPAGTQREVSRMSQEKPTKEIQCESCGNTFLGEAVVSMLGSPPREWWPWECPTCEEKHKLEVERGHQEYLVQARPEERKLMAAAEWGCPMV